MGCPHYDVADLGYSHQTPGRWAPLLTHFKLAVKQELGVDSP
jgi:hypothetical protein